MLFSMTIRSAGYQLKPTARVHVAHSTIVKTSRWPDSTSGTICW
jgi:hypothetical protein